MYSPLEFQRIPWQNVLNASGEDIPPYSIVYNDSDDDIWFDDGTGHIIIPVDKGDNEGAYSTVGGSYWMITGPFVIKAGMKGIAAAPAINCPMIAQSADGQAFYTENLAVGPDYGSQAPYTQQSWGASASSILPLWSAISQVPAKSGATPDKYFVVPKQDIQQTVLLKQLESLSNLAGSTSTVELTAMPDPCPRAAMYRVEFSATVAIDKIGTTVTFELTANSSKYPLTNNWACSRTTADLTLSYGNEETSQAVPGAENVACVGYIAADKGDFIRVKWNCSQSCTVNITYLQLTAAPIGGPYLGTPTPTG